MSLTQHPLWPALQPFVLGYTYKSRDGTRFTSRFDMRRLKNASPMLLKSFLKMEMPCVRCGETIHPVRVRTAGPGGRLKQSGFYASSTCPASVNSGCARSRAASDEASIILKALPRDQVVRK